MMSICNFLIFRTVRKSKRKLIANATQSTTTVIIADEDRISTIKEKPEEEFSNIEVSNNFNKSTNDLLPVPINNVRPYDPNDSGSFRVSAKNMKKNSNIVSKADEIPLDDDSSVTYSHDTSGTGNNGKHRSESKTQRRRGKARQEEIRLATLLAVVVAVFVMCWMPYCVSMLLSIYGPPTVPRGFHMFTILIGYLNSGMNPIIYGVMNRKFGNGFKKILCCLCAGRCDKFQYDGSST